MKLFIGGILALLCLQAINGDQCGDDLTAYRANVKNWFTAFEIQHDIAHDDLTVIQDICTGLTNALTNFLDPNNQITECQIATFFDDFYAARIAALEAITHLRYYCDVLLNMADEYRCGRNDVCIDDFTGSTCETDTNTDQCELIDFFVNLATYGAQAKASLDLLLKSCDELGLLARNFDCSNKSSCSGGQSDPNIVPDFESFVVGFNSEHNVAHGYLETVTTICDTLTLAIQYFENK